MEYQRFDQSLSETLFESGTMGQMLQAFRFMVDLGHCPMISKYGQSLSKAVGPVDQSFLVVKKSLLNKNVHLTASLQKVCVGCQYSKTCLKQPLKKDQNK